MSINLRNYSVNLAISDDAVDFAVDVVDVFGIGFILTNSVAFVY